MTVSNVFPTAESYVNEPVRYPQLRVLDLLAEAHGLAGAYHNVVLNRINQHCLRLAVLEGAYPWHQHPRSDELFLVVEGHLFIDFPDAPTLRVDTGQVVTIPAGTVHRTRTDTRAVNVCFEEFAADTEFVPPPADRVEVQPTLSRPTG